jgi:hypothetical protein
VVFSTNMKHYEFILYCCKINGKSHGSKYSWYNCMTNLTDYSSKNSEIPRISYSQVPYWWHFSCADPPQFRQHHPPQCSQHRSQCAYIEELRKQGAGPPSTIELGNFKFFFGESCHVNHWRTIAKQPSVHLF